MEEMFGIPPRSLSESDTRDTLEQWSSLMDVQLVSMIRGEFGIEPDSELIEAETVGDLLHILQSRGAFGS
ncbi:MAG TPA: phosphopantetheine-binding protein [Bryobacteraceae bacterium]|nr:phosphopantetheine-binding protein [Bryobacteraceae bacterium]